jgi:hypothetical protein
MWRLVGMLALFTVGVAVGRLTHDRRESVIDFAPKAAAHVETKNAAIESVVTKIDSQIDAYAIDYSQAGVAVMVDVGVASVYVRDANTRKCVKISGFRDAQFAVVSDDYCAGRSQPSW